MLDPGDLAGLCYQQGWKDVRRLHEWLAILFASSGGNPDLSTPVMRPVGACSRGDLVRFTALADHAYGRLYTVESPRSGILAAGTDRLQVDPGEHVLVRAYVGVAALEVTVDELGGNRHQRLLKPASCLYDAAHLQLTRGFSPWLLGRGAQPVNVQAAHRDAAQQELLAWLSQEDPS